MLSNIIHWLDYLIQPNAIERIFKFLYLEYMFYKLIFKVHLRLKLDNYILKGTILKYLININCCNLKIMLI